MNIEESCPRVVKLLNQGRQFIVIGEHELYYPEAYTMIREQERIQETWTPEDENIFQDAIDRWYDIQREMR